MTLHPNQAHVPICCHVAHLLLVVVHLRYTCATHVHYTYRSMRFTYTTAVVFALPSRVTLDASKGLRFWYGLSMSLELG